MRVKGATVQKCCSALALLVALAWNLAHASEIKGLELSEGATGTRAELALDGARRIQGHQPRRPGPSGRRPAGVRPWPPGFRLPAGAGVVKSVRTGQPGAGHRPHRVRPGPAGRGAEAAHRAGRQLAAPGAGVAGRWRGFDGPGCRDARSDACRCRDAAGDNAGVGRVPTAQVAEPPPSSTRPHRRPPRRGSIAEIVARNDEPTATTAASANVPPSAMPSVTPMAPARPRRRSSPPSRRSPPPSPPAFQPASPPACPRRCRASVAATTLGRVHRAERRCRTAPSAGQDHEGRDARSRHASAGHRDRRRPRRSGSRRARPVGTREKDVTLAIARELARQVNATPGLKAYLTRDSDVFIPLAQRYQKARAAKADMFISIHADAFNNRDANGSSVFVLSQRGASSQAARWLADQENAADLVGGVRLERQGQHAGLGAARPLAERDDEGLRGHRRPRAGRPEERRRDHKRERRARELRRAALAGRAVDAGRDRLHHQSRRGDAASTTRRHQRDLARAILDGVNTYFTRQPPPGTLYAARADAQSPALRSQRRQSLIARAARG